MVGKNSQEGIIHVVEMHMVRWMLLNNTFFLMIGLLNNTSERLLLNAKTFL